MFAIAESQSVLLAKGTHGAFLRSAADRLRRDFPDELEARSDATLLEEIRHSFDRLRASGFCRKENLYRLIALELLYGPNFETALPDQTRVFSFDGDDNAAPEGERFWAIYKAADCLTRDVSADEDDPFADLTALREAPE